jgi:hypothetical protein
MPRKKRRLAEFTETATRIMTKWREETARAAAKAAIAKAKPKKQRPRGPKRKFDRTKLKQLIKQHPGWTAEQLRTRYEQETGDLPSLKWVYKIGGKFRPQK